MRRLTAVWICALGMLGAVPLYTGLGTVHHAVATKSPQAQKYFDQGLRLCYAFNHDEAIRAFREAARLDPTCAMAHWGVAYALGPNVNLPVDPAREQEAFGEIQKARTLAAKTSAKERDWIEALGKRYSGDPKVDLHVLDVAYADAMKELALKYPEDLDAGTIYAEALLTIHPWDWWTHDGKPAEGTTEAIAELQRVLKKNPSHTGANHFLIHAVEESPAPGRAILAANRLAGLAPNAGHLVHMPSHIYLRIGRYKDAVDLNRKAMAVDRAYIEAEKPQGVYPLMYYTHNMHMAYAALMFEGRSKEAITMARTTASQVDPEMLRKMPDMAAMEFWLPVPYYALARFQKWDEILSEAGPPPEMRFTCGMWHYARCLALNATGKPDLAAIERDSVVAIAAVTPPSSIMGLNSAASLLNVAADVLDGEIALRAGHTPDAIEKFRSAVTKEDALHYDEPPAWYHPTRERLGWALIKGGNATEAEKVFEEDLRRYPGNGWALFGLAEAQSARGRITEAMKTKKRLTRAWVRADFKLASTR
ncbi:MAG TPA: tetratricopeptide repeat protein [Candidatus Polarisedimenticolia bacterium]|nr:tetratricopeptide repeat protein [Candidatus Polarisedimenticolia bacterium]